MKKEEMRALLSLEATIDIVKVEILKEKGRNVKYVHIKSNKKIKKVHKNIKNLN